jgi:hypothetical protein
MRTTFAFDLDLRPISVNAPIAQPHVLRVGDVFFFAAAYSTEYGDVPEGTKVFVQHVADEDGATWLRAEGDVPALFHWDNLIVIVPYLTEDLLPCLRAAIRCPVASLLPDACDPLPPSNVRPLGRVVRAVALIAVLTGLLAPTTLQYARLDLKHATHRAYDVEPIAPTSLVFAHATG